MKKKGFAPIIILVLIALGVVGYFGYKNLRSNSLPTPTLSATALATADPTANWKTYTTSKKYGFYFTFNYPPNYSVALDNDVATDFALENSTRRITVGYKKPDNLILDKDQTFLGISSREALQLCATSGESYCDKIVKSKPIINSHGLKGYKFYLNQITHLKPLNEKTIGPVFAYEIYDQTNKSLREIEVAPETIIYDQATEEEQSVAEFIANSISIRFAN